MTQVPASTAERLPLWVGAAHKLAGRAAAATGERGGPLLITSALSIQDLGYVEASIMEIESRLPAAFSRQAQAGEGWEVTAEDLLPNQAIALSRLWVFGLYEAVRTYRAAVRRNEAAWLPFRQLSEELNVIRSPLAKQQVSGRATAHAATPVFQMNTGRVGWQVLDPRTNQHRQIMRMELADAFLSAATGLIGAGEAEAQAKAKAQQAAEQKK